jgi:serine/threonine-protein kinase RsbW
MSQPPDGEPLAPLSSLVVASDLDQIEPVLAWFDGLQLPDVAADLRMQAQLALVEGFTNAVRHAHAPLTAPPSITLSVAVSARLFRLRILDGGGPFDLEAALQALEQELGEGPQDPLARDEHWGFVMLLKLRKDHGWTMHYRPTAQGGNALILSHALKGGEVVPP